MDRQLSVPIRTTDRRSAPPGRSGLCPMSMAIAGYRRPSLPPRLQWAAHPRKRLPALEATTGSHLFLAYRRTRRQRSRESGSRGGRELASPGSSCVGEATSELPRLNRAGSRAWQCPGAGVGSVRSYIPCRARSSTPCRCTARAHPRRRCSARVAGISTRSRNSSRGTTAG